MYSDVDDLFYLLRLDASMYTLDLNRPSPVARKILSGVPNSTTPRSTSSRPVTSCRSGGGRSMRTPSMHDPFAELKTTDVQLYKVDLRVQRLEMTNRLHIVSSVQWLDVPSGK
jgi:hypothetical protein